MKLRALELWRFAGVREGHVAFADGLNVLHGPNDQGKTTLVRALRACLLVPARSSAADAFASWSGEEGPEVRVELEHGGEVLVVHKRFSRSRTGFARLQHKRGDSLETLAQGRAVDTELRRRLGWGIPEPGGRGGATGVPTSFLAEALLGEQALPYDVLARSLQDDRDGSGRERLLEALQHVVFDAQTQGLMQTVAQEVQSRFTETGAPKRGKDTALGAAQREREDAEQTHAQLQAQREELERVEVTRAQAEDAYKRSSTQLAALESQAIACREALERARSAQVQQTLARERTDVAARLERLDAELAQLLAQQTALQLAREQAVHRCASLEANDQPSRDHDAAVASEVVLAEAELKLARVQREEARMAVAARHRRAQVRARLEAEFEAAQVAVRAITQQRAQCQARHDEALRAARREDARRIEQLAALEAATQDMAMWTTASSQLRAWSERLRAWAKDVAFHGAPVPLRATFQLAMPAHVRVDSGQWQPAGSEVVADHRMEVDFGAGGTVMVTHANRGHGPAWTTCKEQLDDAMRALAGPETWARLHTRMQCVCQRAAQPDDGATHGIQANLDAIAQSLCEREATCQRLRGELEQCAPVENTILDMEVCEQAAVRAQVAYDDARARYDARVDNIRKRHVQTRDELAQARVQLERLGSEAIVCSQRIATLQGERAQQHVRLQALEEQLAAGPDGGVEMEETVSAVEARLRTIDVEREVAQTARADALACTHQAEGALRLLGGDVLRERCALAEQAHTAASRRAQTLEQEGEAWKCLHESVRAEANAHTQNLGRFVAGEVGPAFRLLTQGRYRDVAFDAHLGVTGVATAFGVRGSASLSEGLKEQLATLLRLTLAQQLGTALVLDDHLTQTDAGRLAWFGERLLEAAHMTQIVVVTARPSDYPANESVHRVDLAQALQRTTHENAQADRASNLGTHEDDLRPT